MKETKAERIIYLEKEFAKYLRLIKRGNYNDARQVARSLEYETYELSQEDKKKRGN